MGAATIGGLIGGVIDEISGGDSPAEGAIIGGATAEVLKVVLPLAVTFAVGWAVLRGAAEFRHRVLGGPDA